MGELLRFTFYFIELNLHRWAPCNSVWAPCSHAGVKPPKPNLSLREFWEKEIRRECKILLRFMMCLWKILRREGSSPRWGQRRSPGNRAWDAQHTLHAQNLPGHPHLLWRTKSRWGGQWGDVDCLLPGQYCPCCKLSSSGQDSHPIYERVERPEVKEGSKWLTEIFSFLLEKGLTCFSSL